MQTIDVGRDFYHRLANRDKNQGDGKYTAIQFREKYLKFLDQEDIWKKSEITAIILDFCNVQKIGPSFANEAFAYFTKYAKPDKIRQLISFKNITKVQQAIINEEIETGYKRL